jgi:cysteine desulfurase family protein
MKEIYLDNASTSFPKAPGVGEAVYEYMVLSGANINRGSYGSAYSALEKVLECRELLAETFNGGDYKNVVFTKNVTESLNIIIRGLLKEGDHVLVSSMEHNAVMRPITALAEKGISFDRIPCRRDGSLITEEIEALIRPETKAIIMTHASNVCGTLMPVETVGKICKAHGIFFILDSAQSAGLVPIDMDKMNIDALCFTGHKSLLGPQGTGGFVLKEKLVEIIEPFIFGGTGSISDSLRMPDFMPDRFEAGTMNIPGIIGLREALLWLKSREEGSILRHELKLTKYFLEALESEIPDKVTVLGKENVEGRLGVVSLLTPGLDPAMVCYRLDREYGIATRVGLHCAPDAHKSLGSFPGGSLRFSFGYANEEDDVEKAVRALKEICHGN